MFESQFCNKCVYIGVLSRQLHGPSGGYPFRRAFYSKLLSDIFTGTRLCLTLLADFKYPIEGRQRIDLLKARALLFFYFDV